jgi:hypothetical protein
VASTLLKASGGGDPFEQFEGSSRHRLWKKANPAALPPVAAHLPLHPRHRLSHPPRGPDCSCAVVWQFQLAMSRELWQCGGPPAFSVTVGARWTVRLKEGLLKRELVVFADGAIGGVLCKAISYPNLFKIQPDFSKAGFK